MKTKSLADVLADVLTSNVELDGDENAANVVDALFEIARGLQSVARAINLLGNADAATPMGAVEALGKCILDGTEKIAMSLEVMARSIDLHGDTE